MRKDPGKLSAVTPTLEKGALPDFQTQKVQNIHSLSEHSLIGNAIITLEGQRDIHEKINASHDPQGKNTWNHVAQHFRTCALQLDPL